MIFAFSNGEHGHGFEWPWHIKMGIFRLHLFIDNRHFFPGREAFQVGIDDLLTGFDSRRHFDGVAQLSIPVVTGATVTVWSSPTM